MTDLHEAAAVHLDRLLPGLDEVTFVDLVDECLDLLEAAFERVSARWAD